MKRLLSPLLVSATLLLAGCATTPDAAPSGNTVSLGVEQNGGSYQVRAGDTLVINLASNSSTGAAWEYVELNKDMFSEEKTPKPKSHADVPMPGEGGKVSFTLRAKQAGTSRIKMSYHRPWEPEKPWGTFEATITVTP